MYATEWPKRKPAAKDRWMNSSGLNCVKTLFDFRPSDRFAENRFDRDVNMVVLGFLNDPWSTLAMPWMNREVGNCLVSHVEPAEGGYRWRLGFRGRVNDYTRFDISKLDYFGLTLLLADQEEKGIEHYPFYWQLWGAEKKRAV